MLFPHYAISILYPKMLLHWACELCTLVFSTSSRSRIKHHMQCLVRDSVSARYMDRLFVHYAYCHIVCCWRTTNFGPLCHAFLTQRQDFVATRGLAATVFTFSCVRLGFFHSNFPGPYVWRSLQKLRVITTYYRTVAIGTYCCHDLICVEGNVISRCNTDAILQLFS
jgi:hypothetical protein